MKTQTIAPVLLGIFLGSITGISNFTISTWQFWYIVLFGAIGCNVYRYVMNIKMVKDYEDEISELKNRLHDRKF